MWDIELIDIRCVSYMIMEYNTLTNVSEHNIIEFGDVEDYSKDIKKIGINKLFKEGVSTVYNMLIHTIESTDVYDLDILTCAQKVISATEK